jgi:Na+/proline symporter
MHWLDWTVVALSCVLVFTVGLWFARKSSQGGLASYFAGDRDLPWWAIGLSNTATYQSGNGWLLMLLMIHGLAANWLWWSMWVVMMPLVAILWARLWQRAGVVSVAELMSLRYSGSPAIVARKLFAIMNCFCMAVLVIAYITGFFAKTIAPLWPLETWQVLLIFGGCTVAYTMFGGLLGVVYSDVAQFFIMMTACIVLFIFAVPQFGGWTHILHTVQTARPGSLQTLPPTRTVETLTVVILAIQGLFAVGDGTTTQRFIGARSERHAVGGQLFNAFLALSFRTIPLIGLGIIAMSVFWTNDSQANLGAMPTGFTSLEDPVYALAELIKRCSLPMGFMGILVAAEVAAYMSTLSSLINWGSGLVVNDVLPREMVEGAGKIWISRLATLLLFVLAATVTIFFVDNMMSWFLFINSAMGIFMLPLGVLRFGWWRFNVWSELAAIVLGLPLSIIVWFVLDFQHRSPWQGLSLLAGMGMVVLVAISLLTPPEPMETLQKFYVRCRPPGLWGPVRATLNVAQLEAFSWRGAVFSSILGVISCFGLVVATNAVFILNWPQTVIGTALCFGAGGWLLKRVM